LKLAHRILSPALILLAVCLLSLLARQKPKEPKDEEESLCVKFPVWVDTTKPWKPLSVGELKVLSEKTPLDVIGLQDPESPMLLFIAFDMVGELNTVNQARNGVTSELKALRPQFWVGIISAQEQLRVIQEPTPDRELLTHKIDELTQIGKAGLLESIEPIADMASSVLSKTDVRVAVVFITDSDIANYRADYLNPTVNASDSRDLSRRFAGRALQEKISRMTASLARYRAPIFIVHVDPGRDPLNRAYQNGLKQMAEATGGQFFLAKTVSEVRPTIREAFQWARSFYLMAVTINGEKPGYRRIQVLVSNSEATESASSRVIYPSRIFVP
jgi:hypothetical protein